MGAWRSGPGMIQEPEVEAGEDCSYKDDTNIDPDIALSYIGEKVQSILGHFQKDFEGGVSAENLGAKFGGYGSFLPMYQRSTSICLLQPRSPRKDILPKSPDLLNPEGPTPASVTVTSVPSSQKNRSGSPPASHPSKISKASSEDASVRQNATLSSDVVVAFPPKELPSSKLGHQTNLRTLKVRIKVGPEMTARYNAEISNLGLTSSSSSEGNSPEKSGELLLESYEPPSESAANIVQMMTSFPVSGGSLLSPIPEEMLNIVGDMESLVEGEHESALKNSAISDRLLNSDAFGEKKVKYVDKSGNFGRTESECRVDLNDSKQHRNLESNIIRLRVDPDNDGSCKSLSDIGRKSGRDIQLKKRKGSKDIVNGIAISSDLVNDTNSECTPDQTCSKHEIPSGYSNPGNAGKFQSKISNKDDRVGRLNDGRSTVAGNGASLKTYSDNCEGERIKGVTLKDELKATSDKQDDIGKPHAANQLVFEVKNSRIQRSGKWAKKLADGILMPKRTHSGHKDCNRVHRSQTDMVDPTLEHMENFRNSVEQTSGGRKKNSDLQIAAAKVVINDKLKKRSSNKIHLKKVRSQNHTTEHPSVGLSSKQGVPTGLGQTIAAPVVLEENWVACDRCEKWRLLPYGTKSDQLPETWVCSMLDWLPGMNHCDISEDETTKAVQSLYLVPVSESTNNFQAHADQPMFGVSSAGAHHYEQSHKTKASDVIGGHVRKQEVTEKQKASSTGNPVPSSDGKRDLHRWPIKNGSLKELNESLAGVNAASKSQVPTLAKSTIAMSKLNNLNNEHVIGDDANPRKKTLKEPVQLHGKVEKIKLKGLFNVDNFQTTGGNLGLTGNSSTSNFPSKASVKNEKSAKKDVNSGKISNFLIRLKKQEDQTSDLPNNGSSAMETCNGEEVNLKKRKLEDSKDRKHRVDSMVNNVKDFDGRNVSFKEIEFQRNKKPRVLQDGEKKFKFVKCDDISKRKGSEPRVRLSQPGEYPTSMDLQREHKEKKARVKPRLTLEDINKVKQDLGCEQLSTAATSSSSKVSASYQDRIGYMGVEGSPGESVSSSPVRMPYPNQTSPPMMETFGFVDSGLGDLPSRGSSKKFYTNESSSPGKARKGMVTTFCYRGGDFRESDVRDKPIKLVSGVDRPPDFVQSPLLAGPYPNTVHIVNCSYSDGRSKDNSDTKLPPLNSGKSSSSRSLVKNRTLGHALERLENPYTGEEVFDTKNRLKEEANVDNNYDASQYEVSTNNRHALSDKCSIKSARNKVIVGKRDLGERPGSGNGNQSSRRGNDLKSSAPHNADVIQQNLNQDFVGSSLEQTPKHLGQWNEKVRIDRKINNRVTLCSGKLASGSLRRSFKDSRAVEASVVADSSKLPNDIATASHQNGASNFNNHNHSEAEPAAIDVTLANVNVPALISSTLLKEVGDVLKEAEDLRNQADLIKNSGFGSESNYEYFKAALKFLYGAFLLEVLGGENTIHSKMSPVQIYHTAAKICKHSAYEYEKGHEMAAAALAYKCVEVACLKMVYCKSSTASRYWNDLQSSMQMVPHGESPSSSASDIDNLNNLAVADRASLSKGNGFHAGNHVLLPHNHANLVRLLDYTKDVNFAMEAARKFEITFAAANVKLEESRDNESIVAIKRVLSFSFHDVEELIRLVWLAFDIINRQRLSRNGE